jgi:hypothetical protein
MTAACRFDQPSWWLDCKKTKSLEQSSCVRHSSKPRLKSWTSLMASPGRLRRIRRHDRGFPPVRRHSYPLYDRPSSLQSTKESFHQRDRKWHSALSENAGCFLLFGTDWLSGQRVWRATTLWVADDPGAVAGGLAFHSLRPHTATSPLSRLPTPFFTAHVIISRETGQCWRGKRSHIS